jgi:hypothetical protein
MTRDSYLKLFPEIYEEIKQSITNKISKLQSTNINPNFIDRYYEMLANDYCNVGIGEICLNNNIVEAKKNFYMAGKLQESLFQKYDNKEIKVSSSFITMNKYKRLLLAILSDSEELTASLSKLLGGRIKEEKEHGHPFSDNVGYTVKFFTLNEDERAYESIGNLKKVQHQREVQPFKAHINVLVGILERNESIVNEGLYSMIESHKSNDMYKDTADELLSVEVLGFEKLAELKGLRVTINDEIAPYRVLKKDIIEYPKLDFIN